MIKVEDIEAIRRAYFIEGLSMREIARTLHHGRRLVKKAIRTCLKQGSSRLDSIRLHLRGERTPELLVSPLDLAGRPKLQGVGEQPVRLTQYDRLLRAS